MSRHAAQCLAGMLCHAGGLLTSLGVVDADAITRLQAFHHHGTGLSSVDADARSAAAHAVEAQRKASLQFATLCGILLTIIMIYGHIRRIRNESAERKEKEIIARLEAERAQLELDELRRRVSNPAQ